MRNNPVGYFYANCRFGLKTKSCHVDRIRELAISGLFLSLWEDFTPVGFLAEVRLEDDLSLNFIGGIEGNQYRNTALIKTYKVSSRVNVPSLSVWHSLKRLKNGFY